MVHLAKTVHLCCTNTNNISNGTNEIPHDPRHLGIPTGASRTIYEPMVCLAQTVHLSYINTNIISKRTEWDSHDPRHQGVPSGVSKTISEPIVRLAQTVLLSYFNTNTRTEQDSTWPTSPRSSIGCVQNDIWAYGMFSANRAPFLYQH